MNTQFSIFVFIIVTGLCWFILGVFTTKKK